MPEGKLVDKWYWRREDGEMVEIPVRLIKDTDQHDRDEHDRKRKPPFQLVRSKFHVKMKEPVEIDIESTDCEALQDAVFGELEEFYAVKWERYYLVTIRPDRPYEGLGTGFCLEYTDIEKGTTWEGKFLMRRYRHRGFEVTPWPGEFKDERGRVQACIPATEVNREGLQEFTDRIITLRQMLMDFLKPEVIEKHLANLANSAKDLLPAPNQKMIELDQGGSRRRGRRRS